jgi:hypothetical protein
MKVFDGFNQDGKLVYFEISSIYGRWATYKFIGTLPNVEFIKRPRYFSLFGDDVFCVFRLGSQIFQVWEPWGDNSRFHIGTNPVVGSPELEALRNFFLNHKPWPLCLLGRPQRSSLPKA